MFQHQIHIKISNRYDHFIAAMLAYFIVRFSQLLVLDCCSHISEEKCMLKIY